MSVIQIKNFTKKFGKKVAVNNLSFSIEEGEIMSFLGGNGSGKTTTIRSLLGIYHPTQGELLIDGQTYTSKMNYLIGYLPEERGLYTRANVYELLMYFSRLRGFDDSTAKERIDDYLKRVDMYQHKDKKITDLSSGMQQKIQIATATLHRPRILILDEPFKGLDAVNRQLFTDYFRELNKKYGSTILYSTHIVDEAQRMADKVIMIKGGKRVEYGTIDEVRSRNGSNTINIEYKKELKEDNESKKLFSARISNKTAELTPKKGVDSSEILKYLTKKEIGLTSFIIDRPTLNQIFINLQKHE